jgi:hypothetical protein
MLPKNGSEIVGLRIAAYWIRKVVQIGIVIISSTRMASKEKKSASSKGSLPRRYPMPV